MKESEIETHFKWVVESMGGKTWKFTSPSNRGVSDRIACLPDGSTWFVELKTRGGRLSPLQEVFAAEMEDLKQNYRCFWNKEQINQWRGENVN
jgi:hypothetical protein